jgi:hypothetical protein
MRRGNGALGRVWEGGGGYGTPQSRTTGTNPPLILPAPASFPQPEKFRQSVRQCGRQRDAKTIVGALLIGVVDGLSTWQHALVQDAANQDTGQFAAEEDDVAGLLGTQQAGTNVIARSTERGRVGQALAIVVK